MDLGRLRCRSLAVSNNATHQERISEIKSKTAEIINIIESLKNDEYSKTYNQPEDAKNYKSGEKIRLASLSQTSYEEAFMWAEKFISSLEDRRYEV